MKEKIVRSRWLEAGDRRLDPAPYLSGKLEILEQLTNLRCKKQLLSTLTDGHDGGIYNGPQFGRRYVLDRHYGVPFLTSSAFLRADLSLVPLLSKRDATSDALSFLRIEPGMVLISCSGTTGRMAFAGDVMRGMWSCQDIMKVVPNREVIRPGYLYAFLASKFGVPLITGDTYGSMVLHLEPDHIKELPVPRLSNLLERQAHDKVAEAAKLRSEYQRQVQAATGKLFAAVSLKDITSSSWHNGNPDLGFARKLNSPSSLRALNFNPRFQQLCDMIRSKSWRPLGQLCKPETLRTGPRFKRIDADPKYAYKLIGQKEVFWFRAEGRWIAKTATPAACLVPSGSTLVAAHGTFGESELYCRSEFIWGSDTGRAYSQDFLRVVPEETLMTPGCMFAFLRSEIAFRMLRSVSIGTKLQEHHPDFTAELPIPYPDRRFQDEIHQLVTDAYEKRHRSVKLEDEAVALVEQAIEGGA